MEELQDAIEDAQYVSAISAVEDGPRPVLPWEIPDEEQLKVWKEGILSKYNDSVAKAAKQNEKKNIEKKNEKEKKNEGSSSSSSTCSSSNSKMIAAKNPKPVPYEFEWTLAQELGFFLFSAYLKEVAEEHVEINFMEEVLRWKTMSGRFRAEKTSFIADQYLCPLPEGVTSVEPTHAPRVTVVADPSGDAASSSDGGGESAPANEEPPAAKKIHPTENGDGVDRDDGGAEDVGPPKPPLPPKRPQIGPPKTQITEYDLARKPAQFSPEELREIRAQSYDPTKNCISVGGPVLDTIFNRVDKLRKSPGYSSLPSVHEDREASENENGVVPDLEAEHTNEEESEQVMKKKRSLRNLSLVSNELPEHLLDEAEVIVAESVRERHWEGFRASEHNAKLLNFLWFQDRIVVEEDFFVMRVLGRGGFGLVTACKKGTSGKLYAMKIQNKKRIKIKKAEQLTLNERKCLADVNSPFVVNLKYSFQSSSEVFLILDLMTGGDLSYHLSQRGLFPKTECLYYGARIMLGLQALHDKGYVYRDLKPENCLLGEDGRVKLTDLGLATKVKPTLHGAAGTRGYWAPEMLRRDDKGKRMNYNQMVDWFSFGCCLAEFISGTNPFRSEVALNFGLDKGKKTKEKAIDCATLEMHPEFDSAKFDDDASEICRRLLDKTESTRLGVNGCKEIMSQPWFREVNWEEIISDRTRPPFLPPKDVNAASQSEIGTFAEDKTFHETVLSEKDEAVYDRWNFTNSNAFAAEVIEFLIYERETGKPLLPIEPNTSCCCTII